MVVIFECPDDTFYSGGAFSINEYTHTFREDIDISDPDFDPVDVLFFAYFITMIHCWGAVDYE